MPDGTTYLPVDVDKQVDEKALKEEKQKIGKLADKVKFITTTGAHLGTVACIGMRPGGADGKEERDLNLRVKTAVIAAAKEAQLRISVFSSTALLRNQP